MSPSQQASGRAPRACDACRARKTRCYDSADSDACCLRCSTLHLPCSLRRKRNRSPEESRQHSCSDVEMRLAHLENTVERLSKTIERSQTDAVVNEASSAALEENLERAAPLVVIQDAVQEVNIQQSGQDTLMEAARTRDQPNIVSKRIVSREEVGNLLRIFQHHYGRWLAVSEDHVESFTINDIHSALLLCCCCLIAVRHSPEQYNISPALFTEARTLLGDAVLQTTDPIELVQAIILLSLWPTSTGGRLLSFDPWLITSIAFQHASISNTFGLNTLQTPKEVYTWNHLCLSHLHACISMRRPASITRKDLEKGRQALDRGSVSNFELRMFAEMLLYWTVYENCFAFPLELPKVQAALKSWKAEWSSLFEQPRSQFLQLSFSFAQLLMYEQALNKKSAAVRESLLSEMVRLAIELLTTAMNTIDDRTKYLTDHIYHMIAFASVTLTRLIFKYEGQLKVRYDIGKADSLILSTIRWLQVTEGPSHVSHMMSSVIKATYQKLRPAAHPPLVDELEQTELRAEDLIVPDFLGMDSADFDWDSVIPDWQSLASDEFLSPVNTGTT